MDTQLVNVLGAEILLLTLPWLNPLTYGPTHAVLQWVTVWFGAALCWMLSSLSFQNRASKVHIIAWSWILAASLSAGIGLLQYFGLSQHFSPFVNYLEAGQAFANLRQRNQLASLLSIGLCALLWARRDSANQNFADATMRNVVWGCAGLLLCAADAASGSRTGMLQLLLLWILSVVWKRHRAAVAYVLAAYVLAAIALPQLVGLGMLGGGILGRIHESVPACASRLTLWSNVLQLIVQKPWLGWGWGGLEYAHFITLYPGMRFCEILGNAHNLPLHLAVELGIPIALAFCGLIAWIVVHAKPWKDQDPTRQMAWSVMAIIGLHSLLEYPLWYAPFQLALVLAIWILWPRAAREGAVTPGSGKPWYWGIAVSVLVVCAYVTWDYWRISQIYLPFSQRAAMYRDDTLEKTKGSWLFQGQMKFAELGVTPLTAENASEIHALALEMLHFSPEASVVQKLIESADLLGNSAEVQFFSQRFQAAFPDDYAKLKSGGK